jgi:hypothetical protein
MNAFGGQEEKLLALPKPFQSPRHEGILFPQTRESL